MEFPKFTQEQTDFIAEAISSAPTLRGVEYSEDQNEAVDDVAQALAELFTCTDNFDADAFIALSRGE